MFMGACVVHVCVRVCVCAYFGSRVCVCGFNNKGLTSCRPEPSSRRHVNKEAYGLSSVHLKKKKKNIQLL